MTLTLDEYETIRVIDLEKLTHEQCARQMDISRTTVTEIYESAREKIADSLVNGKTLVIAGGGIVYVTEALRRAAGNTAGGSGRIIQRRQ